MNKLVDINQHINLFILQEINILNV